MELSIAALQAAGSFTGAPILKTISWKQGGEDLQAQVYVRRLSYRSAVSDLQAMRGQGDPVAGRIAACIVDAEGKPVFTPEDITGEASPDRGPLDGNLTVALLQVIGEVNNLGKTTGSATKTSSGTNSSSTELADAPSQKHGKTSASTKCKAGPPTAGKEAV